MRRSVLAAIAVLVGTGAGVAADDPIQARQKLMKANGAAAKGIVAIMKGAAPFKLETAQAALNQFIETSEKAPALFPADSDKGKTNALPAIWQNKSDFEAKLAKLGADSKLLLASVKDEASFKANFPPLFKDCGACHELYRAKEK
ncbi:MAG: cytochrome c [Pseudomonadota bacterium]|nr:cytochrome c [Pseudomonadota bacterium]